MIAVRRHLGAAIGLGLVLLAVFRPVATHRATFAAAIPGTLELAIRPVTPVMLDPMDSAWFGNPLAMIVAENVASGRSLIWSAATGCGEPLVATSLGAVTSPLRWWTRWGAVARDTWDTFYLVRLWLAGWLAFGLALTLGLPVPASAATGCAYMLSGHLVVNLNLGMLDGDVLLPGLAWAGIVLATSLGRAAFALSALLGAGILLVGNPQIALLAAVLCGSLAATTAPVPRPAAVRRVAAAGVVAALLAAPLLFSLIDLFPRAQQVHGGQGTVAIPWQGALSLVAPWIYGSFGQHWLGRNPFEFLAWVGLVPVVLAGVGARTAWRSPGGWVLCALPVILWGFAFGIPPFNVVARLPVLNLVWWSKYQAPTALCVAILAGFGASRVRAHGPRAWAPALLIALELGCLVPRTWATWDCFQLDGGTFGDELLTLARTNHTPDRRDYRWFGLGRWPMPHPLASIGLKDASTYFGLYPRRAYWYLRALVTGPAHDAHEAVFTGPVRPLLPNADRALAALAVRWIVAGPMPSSPAPRHARALPATGRLRLVELPDPRPRARTVARAIRVPDARTALSETSIDPAGNVIFAEGPADWIGFRITGVPAPARILSDSGAEIAVDVAGEGPRVLLLADTYEPGWRAEAEGRRIRVLPANCMFKAVAVPPGAHAVHFTYDPMPLKAGFLASGLGAGWLAALLLPAAAPARRRRRT